MTIKYAEFGVVRDWFEAKDGSSLFLVWPDEGEFKKEGGAFIFNEDHGGEVFSDQKCQNILYESREDERDGFGKTIFEPLYIDKQSANVLITVYDAIQKPENREKFETLFKEGRGGFASVIEFCWKAVSKRN